MNSKFHNYNMSKIRPELRTQLDTLLVKKEIVVGH